MSEEMEVRWCSACQKHHPLYTVNEDGELVPTFSRSTRTKWQTICKKAATRINVKRQRERRQQEAEQVSKLDLLIERRNGIIMRELHGLRRLAKRYGKPLKVTFNDIKEMFEASDYACVACHSPHPNVAHIVTLERGGISEPDNIICLCNTCKVTRGHEDINQWAKRLWLTELV